MTHLDVCKEGENMPTINQLVRHGRGKKVRKPKAPVLLVGVNTIQTWCMCTCWYNDSKET